MHATDEAERQRAAMAKAGRVSQTSIAIASLDLNQRPFETLSKATRDAITDAIVYCMRVCFHKVAYAQRMTRRQIVNNGLLGGVSQFVQPRHMIRHVYIRHPGAMLLLNVENESPRAETMRRVYGR